MNMANLQQKPHKQRGLFSNDSLPDPPVARANYRARAERAVLAKQGARLQLGDSMLVSNPRVIYIRGIDQVILDWRSHLSLAHVIP